MKKQIEKYKKDNYLIVDDLDFVRKYIENFRGFDTINVTYFENKYVIYNSSYFYEYFNTDGYVGGMDDKIRKYVKRKEMVENRHNIINSIL